MPLAAPVARFGNELDLNFFLDNLECEGNEESLFDCDHNGLTVHDCMRGFSDAGLICGTTGM